MMYVIHADDRPNVTKQTYVYFHREGHGAAWRFDNVNLPRGFESGLVQDFQRQIMFLPSQSRDIVSMLCR